jgi:hypothetical protein
MRHTVDPSKDFLSGVHSSGTSPEGPSADSEDETTPSIRASGIQLEHAHGMRREDRQVRATR